MYSLYLIAAGDLCRTNLHRSTSASARIVRELALLQREVRGLKSKGFQEWFQEGDADFSLFSVFPTRISSLASPGFPLKTVAAETAAIATCKRRQTFRVGL
jgi:hypothetical protein